MIVGIVGFLDRVEVLSLLQPSKTAHLYRGV
jgi:hypothetical protein